MLTRTLRRVIDLRAAQQRWFSEASYLLSDRRAWRTGYAQHRNRYLNRALADASIAIALRERRPLPAGYGRGMDARVIELPWVLAQLTAGPAALLDAGSSLNREPVLKAPALRGKQITIATLAPEPLCFWQLGVSYWFGDLRQLAFRSELFDTVVSVSTLEHVGMDNQKYAGGEYREAAPQDFLTAVSELRRVLKPGGSCLITVPFGRYESHGWFQQFDAALTDRLIDAFAGTVRREAVYRYGSSGWQVADRDACRDCQFFDVNEQPRRRDGAAVTPPADGAAAERAVLCLHLVR